MTKATVCSKAILCLMSLLVSGVVLHAEVAAESMERYDVIWESPSKDSTGQMPLGNGDIAAGVYAIEDGDLYLLLAKNDAFTYNGDIFKTGRVRVSLDPNPFAAGKPFRQTLDLDTGSILIEANGVALRIWADANRPVYHVQIDSPSDLAVSAAPEFWERFDGCKWNVSSAPIENPTQDVRLERDGKILWYFGVGDRSAFPAAMEYYDVPKMISQYPDPLRFNTFGNLLESPDLTLEDGSLAGTGKVFDIRIHALTKQAPKISDWIVTIEQQAAQPLDVARDWKAHCQWWSDFWDRSWIIASDNTLPPELREKFDGEAPSGKRKERDGGALVAQSYNVFRFLMACQSRGKIQTKFNGGLFTQPLSSGSQPRRVATQREDGTWLSHEDDRDWGRRFTYQNQRLLYWPLLMSGDGEMMQPFFNYYWDLLPVRKAITKAWFGHEGAYYRENIEPTGSERDCGRDGRPPKTKPGENKGEGYYHSYYFTCGLETVAMMIEYAKYSGDEDFRDHVLVPFAREVLLFFDKHYARDADGEIRLDPSMVLETWWIAVNPAPDIAGLLHCLDELVTMEAGSAQDRVEWKRFRAEIPDVFLHEIDGRTAIAPAESWEMRKNSENGLLYPVFPFRRFGLGLGSEDIVQWTMEHRTNKNAFNYKCWTQDQIHWAYAGKAAEAQEGLIHRFRHASPQCRFPMYGSAGPDSCPDFDHFGSGATALQRMLVQEAGDKILLLPAWPADWDADFRLHLAKQTVICGKVVDGKLVDWSIEPAQRKKDVVVCEPQAVPVRPVVPQSDHPVRIGRDHSGGSRFKGEIGRVTMFRGKLEPEMIRELAAGKREDAVAGESVVRCELAPEAEGILATEPDDFAGAVSFEAWIRPEKGEAGRIVDKLTAGKRDGFLIDCWPDLSLRVIVGGHQDDYAGVLQPGVWQHVAVVIGKWDVEVYLNGEEL
jgi:alpha-L-fucosidase 2